MPLRIAFDPIYMHPVPAGHKFPMEKYELLPEQLIYEGTCTDENFFSPTGNQTFDELEAGILDYILEVHQLAYYQLLKTQNLPERMVRRIGFEQSLTLFQREVIIAKGTIQCVDFALKYGVSMNIAGGTHHAYSDKGEGFCLLNDAAIASAYLLKNKIKNRILIIDLDVHQGNGTAEIFKNNPSVFTFSMHGAENYPLVKEQSDLDISLKTGTQDEEYLLQLKENLPKLIQEFRPDFLFYIAGVDVIKTDKLGKLSLTIEGCKARDRFVFDQAKANNLPIVVMMGGGYSTKLSEIIEAHANTFRLVQEVFF